MSRVRSSGRILHAFHASLCCSALTAFNLIHFCTFLLQHINYEWMMKKKSGDKTTGEMDENLEEKLFIWVKSTWLTTVDFRSSGISEHIHFGCSDTSLRDTRKKGCVFLQWVNHALSVVSLINSVIFGKWVRLNAVVFDMSFCKHPQNTIVVSNYLYFLQIFGQHVLYCEHVDTHWTDLNRWSISCICNRNKIMWGRKCLSCRFVARYSLTFLLHSLLGAPTAALPVPCLAASAHKAEFHSTFFSDA